VGLKEKKLSKAEVKRAKKKAKLGG